LQVFHLDVAKVDADVAYVAMTVNVCFKRIFQVFYLFQSYVASVSLNVSKVNLGEHMLQWRRWLAGCCRSRLLLLLGAPPWVTVRAPEADRCLYGAHP
jgi:hypothetical protein